MNITKNVLSVKKESIETLYIFQDLMDFVSLIVMKF